MELSVQKTMSAFPTVISFDERLIIAYRLMKSENFRHLPVVNYEGKLVGIISDRDIQRAMWPFETVDAHGLPEGPLFAKEARVLDHMSRPVKALLDSDELITAVNLMIDDKVSAVVVVKEDKMVGIITHEDLLKVLAAFLREPTSLKEKFMALTYNSPLGKVLDFLAGSGI